jgi:hypothetical protein
MKGDIGRQSIFMILVRVTKTMQSIKWLFLKGYYYWQHMIRANFALSHKKRRNAGEISTA